MSDAHDARGRIVFLKALYLFVPHCEQLLIGPLLLNCPAGWKWLIDSEDCKDRRLYISKLLHTLHDGVTYLEHNALLRKRRLRCWGFRNNILHFSSSFQIHLKIREVVFEQV